MVMISNVPTTNGEAAAPGLDLFATKRVYGKARQLSCGIVIMTCTYLVCTGHDQADNKDTANIENQDTEESPANGDRDVLSRGLRLADRNTDQFRTNVRKEGVRECAPESEEDGKMVVVDLVIEVRAHRAIWVVPVAEAKTVMSGVSAKVDDDTHE